MTINKYEVQKASYQHIGEKLDDALEACQREVNEAVGGQKALIDATKSLNSVIEQARKETKDLSPEEAGPVMKMLGRVQEGISGLSIKWKTREIAMCGKTEAMQVAVDMVKKEYDTVGRKEAARREAEQNPGVIDIKRGRRPSGVKPPNPREALRGRTAEPEPEAEEKPKLKSVEKPVLEPKKKRGRRKVPVPKENGVTDAPNT